MFWLHIYHIVIWLVFIVDRVASDWFVVISWIPKYHANEELGAIWKFPGTLSSWSLRNILFKILPYRSPPNTGIKIKLKYRKNLTSFLYCIQNNCTFYHFSFFALSRPLLQRRPDAFWGHSQSQIYCEIWGFLGVVLKIEDFYYTASRRLLYIYYSTWFHISEDFNIH